MMRLVLRALVLLGLLGLLAWGALALGFAGPPGWATGLAAVWALAGLAVLVLVRPFGRKLAAFAALAALLFVWWGSLEPRNDRDWLPDVARAPWGEVHGDLLTMHNVRNFDYRSETDFTERWETRTYDLSKLERLDLFLSYWGSPAIAHTIMSWAFRDGQHLAVSIETRKERGEQYSAVAGFFRQYELYYVAADERDVIGVRANHRGEEVHLYPLRTPLDRARRMLLDYVAAMNALAERPAWYNALTQNCTTTIRMHTKHIGAAMPLDWRLLANGYIDRMLYERGVIVTTLPFPELRQESNVVARAQAADGDPDFPARIRRGR